MMQTVVKSFYDIPGWFWWLDQQLFEALLEAQSGSEPGVLVEMGTYLGKSAVIIGDHVRAGERFVALDLFGDTAVLGDSAADEANRRESQKSYKTLTRQQFESNYLALHPELPDVVAGLSSQITDVVEPNTARFIHVDASHMYGHVRVDAANTRTLLRPGGVVVFDDFRSEHTPGVSAAVWEAVCNGGLIPLVLTTQKFYGVYDDPEPYRSMLRQLFAGSDRYQWEEQEILGHQVLRVRTLHKKKAAAPPPPPAPVVDVEKLAVSLADRVAPLLIKQLLKPPAAPPKPVPAPVRPRPRPAPTTVSGKFVRRVARNVAPPALTKWVLSLRS